MTTATPNFSSIENFALSESFSLAAKKEKFYSSQSTILRAFESLCASFLQTLGVILLFVLLLQPLAPWLSRPSFQNHTWEKTFPSSTSHLEKTTYNYDAASGSSLYCNGDPVNGLDPDGRCVEGTSAGWANGNGQFAGTYDSSQASSQLAYGLGWTVGATLGDINAVGGAVLTGVNATIDFAEDIAHVPRGSATAATFMFGPEIGDAVAGLRVWGSLRAGTATIETTANLERGIISGTVQPFEVGRADDLLARSVRGDGLDIHHVAQAHPLEQIIPSYNRSTAPAISIPFEQHRAIPTLRGPYTGTSRNQLAKDILDLRNYTDAPNTSLQELIDLNKQIYPEAYIK